MRLTDYLDKGASLGARAPCLTMAGQTRTYGDVQRVSWRVARALHRSGVRPGDKVAILSANDPVAFSCVFGIARAGAVWCPVNPRNQAAENRELLDLFDCTCLIFQGAFAPLVAEISPGLPKLRTLVCLDERPPGAVAFGDWTGGLPDEPWQADPPDDTAMIAGTGGTTGRPKGVLLTGRNLETMSAIVLMSYPFTGRPVYLALAPLTHAAEAGRHGWHHTGDIGYLDDDNYLFIVDRAKDMIITGGFNVYSVEVEQALMRHAAVQDCAVVGLPDDKWGERVTAVVQPYPGRSVTGADLRAFAKDQLGSVKAPKQVEVWPDLPRSKVGKILKGEIKARLLDGPPPP